MSEDPRRGGDTGMVRPFLTGHGRDDETVDPLGSTHAVRPFLLTRGRTTAAVPIAIEAQVVATRAGRDALPTLALEYRDIVLACEEPLAVAEVAATLDLHLGVVRVLIGDLTQQGLVSTGASDADTPDDVETIMRVIDGLRQRS